MYMRKLSERKSRQEKRGRMSTHQLESRWAWSKFSSCFASHFKVQQRGLFRDTNYAQTELPRGWVSDDQTMWIMNGTPKLIDTDYWTTSRGNSKNRFPFWKTIHSFGNNRQYSPFRETRT